MQTLDKAPPVTAFTFTVAGTPVGKGRPRVTMRGTFTPKRTREYEAAIADWAALILPWGWPRDKAYRLTVRYTGRRSDGDNILKAVADALQGITYDNDRQIDEHIAIRLNDKPPRTEITVEILQPVSVMAHAPKSRKRRESKEAGSNPAAGYHD